MDVAFLSTFVGVFVDCLMRFKKRLRPTMTALWPTSRGRREQQRSLGSPGTNSSQDLARIEQRGAETPRERSPIPIELPTPRDRKWRTLPPKRNEGGSAEREHDADGMIWRRVCCGLHFSMWRVASLFFGTFPGGATRNTGPHNTIFGHVREIMYGTMKNQPSQKEWRNE